MVASKTTGQPADPFARFALIPIKNLLPHEEIVPKRIDEILQEIKDTSGVPAPIVVAEGSWVVLDGHHRLEALRRLGAKRVPAWLVDYDDSAVSVEKWPDAKVRGSPTKKAIVARAKKGVLYPPKTSRHKISKTLPQRVTPLSDLF
jgi:hypothetical protein